VDTQPPATDKLRCFVVMGFGTKTDYATGRKLDLNKSYRLLIKPVVEERGVECIRADEIRYSGSIDVHMYHELLKADVVIADLSTANVNAFYELGIRHALRPFRTIVISEDKLNYPFDLNHIKITSYTHLGDAIDFEEVERFRKKLSEVLQEVLSKEEPDSPVYTYLERLIPPSIQEQIERDKTAQAGLTNLTGVAGSIPEKKEEDLNGKVLSSIIDEGEEAIAASDFATAKNLFESALIIGKAGTPANETPANDPYLVQRLALATYKSQQPDKVTSLKNALHLLEQLDLGHTNDPETVSLAGSIEKKLYEEGAGEDHLSNAILYYQRGYYLLNNRYNGINLAFTLNYRANSSLCKTKEEQIADMIYANYTRKQVLFLCEQDWNNITKRESSDNKAVLSEQDRATRQAYYNEQKYWILINKAEANFGLGEFEAYKEAREQASAVEHADWMMQSLDEQIVKLRELLVVKGDLLNPKWVEEPQLTVA
jgi:hypothetical protein